MIKIDNHSSHPANPACAALSRMLGTEPPWVAGVLNTTPDSFSDGELWTTPDGTERWLTHFGDASDIIDIGGESTAPGSKPITREEEIDRIRSALARATGYVQALKHPKIISVDTYKAATAEFGLTAGASMINDVSALRADPDLATVVRDHGAFIVLMFSVGAPLPHVPKHQRTEYEDPVTEIGNFLEQRIDYAVGRGISPSKILLDPGMGAFISENPRYSWELLRRLDELSERFREFPIYVGLSRKGFMNSALPSPLSARERDPLSQHLASCAAGRGASVIRTHDPVMCRQFLAADTALRLNDWSR